MTDEMISPCNYVISLVRALLLVFFISYIQCVDFWQPEQIHLAFGETTDDIVVVWTTFNKTEESTVEYGEVGLRNRANGSSRLFVDGGKLKREQWIHKVTLIGLKRNTSYYYHCGSSKGWSDLFFFKTTPAGSDFQVRAVFYGDLGNVNAMSLGPLQEEIQNDPIYDVLFHIGDFAYDMDTDNALVGDAFMKQIEPVAAYLPYMTCPGNHEEKYNFSNYKHRFRMPNDEDGRLFYSFNLGPVHFISINTEVYYFYLKYGEKQILTQYNWLVKDLVKANKNRAEQPWIVLFGHRPMYCSTNDNDDCGKRETLTRVGVRLPTSDKLQYGIEPLLLKYKVDIVLWAHEHAYERLWPIYNYTVYKGSNNQPYLNPRAPIHITSGSAGCQEKVDNFLPKPEWSAFRSNHYGYSRFNAYNGTHIYIEQFSVDMQPPAVIDSYWIIKDTHNE